MTNKIMFTTAISGSGWSGSKPMTVEGGALNTVLFQPMGMLVPCLNVVEAS